MKSNIALLRYFECRPTESIDAPAGPVTTAPPINSDATGRITDATGSINDATRPITGMTGAGNAVTNANPNHHAPEPRMPTVEPNPPDSASAHPAPR